MIKENFQNEMTFMYRQRTFYLRLNKSWEFWLQGKSAVSQKATSILELSMHSCFSRATKNFVK